MINNVIKLNKENTLTNELNQVNSCFTFRPLNRHSLGSFNFFLTESVKY